MKGTLHKPATGSTVATGSQPVRNGCCRCNQQHQLAHGREVKSAKLSSSWAGDDPAKKKELKTRGDTGAGAGRSTNWRSGPRGKRGNDRDRDDQHSQSAPVEARVSLKCTYPKPLRLSELAHKMAIKASEVIKSIDEDWAKWSPSTSRWTRTPR